MFFKNSSTRVQKQKTLLLLASACFMNVSVHRISEASTFVQEHQGGEGDGWASSSDEEVARQRRINPLWGIRGRVEDSQTTPLLANLQLSQLSFNEATWTYRGKALAGDLQAAFIMAYLYDLHGQSSQELGLAHSFYRFVGAYPLERLDPLSRKLVSIANNNLGWLLESGRGVAQNKQAALEKYQLATEHPHGQFNKARWFAMYGAELEKGLNSLRSIENICGQDYPISFLPLEQEKKYWQCVKDRFMELRTHGGNNAQQQWQAETSQRRVDVRIVSAPLAGDALATYECAGEYKDRSHNREKRIEMFRRATALGLPEAWLSLGEEYEKASREGRLNVALSRQEIENILKLAQESHDRFQEYVMSHEKEWRGRFYRYAGEAYGMAASPGQKMEKQALRALAHMYEHGLGGDKDLNVAFQLYLKTAGVGSISSQRTAMRLALMPEVHATTEQLQQVLEWALEQAAKNKDSGFLYLLGVYAVRGIGQVKNEVTGKNYLEEAAAQGHPLAKIWLKVMQQPYAAHLLPAVSMTVVEQELAQRSATLGDHIDDELDNVISGLSLDGNNLSYPLREDFECGLAVLRGHEIENQENVITLNYDYIWKDPFLQTYRALEVPESKVSGAAIGALIQTLIDSPYGDHPAYTAALNVNATTLNNLKYHIMSGDIVLKKRFVRLVEKFSGGEMPRGWRHGAEAYRLATLMLDLAQNEARCRDGLSDYLHAHERKFLGLMGAAPAERAQTFVPLQKMGERLARIFLEYRSDYVSQYFSCLEPSIETQTEGRELIRARMRLPLGLAGSFVDVLHPGFGQGERDIFEPNRIIHCLLEGGALFIAGGTPRYIPPYDPVLLLKLTQDTLGKETQFLYDGFVQYRPDIREKYEKAFTSFEDNVYVRPNADPQEESLFTEKFFEELLVFYGYLKRKG